MYIAVSAWWLAGIPLIAGLVLIKTGLWPRRRGETPHCPACNYNLTGLTSERCPECGTTVTSSTIVYGERHRRPVRAIIGALLLLADVGLVVAVVSDIDWYPWYPNGLLISQLRSNDPSIETKAWREVTQRLKTGSLSAAQHVRLIEIALAEHRPTIEKPWQQAMIDYLWDCHIKGLLSQAQENKFFSQMVSLSLRTRSPVLMGDPIPYSVRTVPRTPSGGLWYEIVDRSPLMLDDKKLPRRDSSRRLLPGSIKSINEEVRFLEADCRTTGVHKLSMALEVIIHQGAVPNDHEYQDPAPVYKQKLPIEAFFTVRSRETEGAVCAIRDPAMEPRLQASITPNALRWKRTPDERTGLLYSLEGELDFDYLPVDVAFDIIVRFNGIDTPIETATLAQRESTRWTLSSPHAIALTQERSVDLILRSNRRLVCKTMDQFAYWEGEIIYKDVPVERAPTTASAE